MAAEGVIGTQRRRIQESGDGNISAHDATPS